VTFVTLLCEATKAWAKDRSGVAAAGTAAVVAKIIGGGTTVDGVGAGIESSACQSNGMAEFLDCGDSDAGGAILIIQIEVENQWGIRFSDLFY